MIKPRCSDLHALEERKHTALRQTLTGVNLVKLDAKQGLERAWWLNKQSFTKYFSNLLKCSRKLLKCEPAIFTYIPWLHYSISLGSWTGAQSWNRGDNYFDSLVCVLKSEWNGCGTFTNGNAIWRPGILKCSTRENHLGQIKKYPSSHLTL